MLAQKLEFHCAAPLFGLIAVSWGPPGQHQRLCLFPPAVRDWTVRGFSSLCHPASEVLRISHLFIITTYLFYFFQKLDGRSLIKLNFATNSEGKASLLQLTQRLACRTLILPPPHSLQNQSFLSDEAGYLLLLSQGCNRIFS